MEQNNKKKTILPIIVSILIIFIILIALIFFLSRNTSKTNEIDKTKTYEFNGLYKNDNKAILLYEEDDNVYYVTFIEYPNVYNYGKLTKENNKAVGNINIIENDNSIEVNDSTMLKGKYSKDKGVSFEEFWTIGFGDTNLFNSKYNETYENDDITVIVFQTKENVARVLIIKDKEIFSSNFSITDSGSLLYVDNKFKYDISYSSDKKTDRIAITKKNLDSNKEEYDYLLNKISDVTMKDFINLQTQ